MYQLMKSNFNPIPFKARDVVEVEVIDKTRNAILVDLMGLMYGIIPAKEWGEEGERLKPKDKTLAFILLLEDEKGYALLSLKKLDPQRTSQSLLQKFKEKETVTVRCGEANKGGLICDLGPIRGFLPVSQLAPSHYPRVAGDKEKILAHLKNLVNQELRVKIIGFDKKTNTPIFSEKAALDNITTKIKEGEILEGRVVGITDFGIFVNLGEFDGLVHVSEVSWQHIEDLSQVVKIGDKVKVKVIGVEGSRVFLSMKRLLPDPFKEISAKYQEGDIVKGRVVRIMPFGILVQIGELVGLVRLSELSQDKIQKPEEAVSLGKEYSMKILKIDQEAHRLELSLKRVKETVEPKRSKKGAKKADGD